MRTRGRPVTIDRGHVVEIAVRLFEDHGYSGTTMDAIAAEAGISRKSLFLYFPTKADLIWSSDDQHVERLADTLASSAHSGLRAVSDAVVAGFDSVPFAADAMRRQVRLHAGDAQVRELVEARGAAWRGAVSHWLIGIGVDELSADMLAFGVWRAMWLALEEWAAGSGDVIDVLRSWLSRYEELGARLDSQLS